MHLGRYVFLHYLSFTLFFPLTSDLIVSFNNLLTVIALLLKVQKQCFVGIHISNYERNFLTVFLTSVEIKLDQALVDYLKRTLILKLKLRLND